DPPPERGWPGVPAETRQAIEAATGVVDEHFALCQTMSRAQFSDVVEQLGRHGYRPLRIRPYLVGSSLQVAAMWARHGRPWQWLGEAGVEQLRTRDVDLRREGFVPVDVSVACSPNGSLPRYTVVWEQAKAADTEVRLMAGGLGEQEQKALGALVEEKFNCQI